MIPLKVCFGTSRGAAPAACSLPIIRPKVKHARYISDFVPGKCGNHVLSTSTLEYAAFFPDHLERGTDSLLGQKIEDCALPLRIRLYQYFHFGFLAAD
jgi:hypothetical protein